MSVNINLSNNRLSKARRIVNGSVKGSDLSSKNVKIVHFVRHAQGMHNVAGQEDPVNGYLREDLVDATLTEVGIDQCKQLRSSSEIESVMSSQLLVVSPMRRTLQTASTIFDGLLKCPWIALEYIREQSGKHPCDRRSTKTELKALFEFVDFDGVVDEVDPLYYNYPTSREPIEHVYKRGASLLGWLKEREESEIIIVSHHAFLFRLFTGVVEIDPPVVGESEHFSNCEMRTYALDLSNI